MSTSLRRFRSARVLASACVCCFALLFGFALQPAGAADLAPSWTALPDETALMLRLPGGQAFIDALQKQTKLGAVVLSPERFERLVQIIRDQSGDDWDSLREALGRVDLKPDDLQGLFHGDLGVAVTLEPRADRAPLVVLLGWLEPGEELAPRVLAALQSLLGDLADEPSPPVRKDIELAGHEVMHLEIPISDLVVPEMTDAEEDDDDSTEKLQERIDEFKKKLNEAQLTVVDHVHVFVSRLGGRIVWASTVPQSSADVHAKSEAERETIDWDALSGLEQATAVFGRFLAAHDGSSPGGAARLLETPGLEPTLPGGTPLVELIADPRPLVKLADRATNPKIKQAVEILGGGGVGPLGLRMTIDGTTLRNGVFLSMPAPRPGLLSLFDQAKLDPAPPSWVPATAIGYQQMSFDLGQAYARIKALVIELLGEPAKKGFDQVEGAAALFLQTNVTELLSAFGSQHSVVTFAPRFVRPGQEKAAQAEGGDASPTVIQRLGVVCRLKDEKDERVLKQFLKAASQMIQGGGGASLRPVEELGVSGYRLDQNGTEVGLFIGNGYLVMGSGPEVSETLLVALRTPPEGDAALRASGFVERGRALIAPQPCLSYELSDAGAGVKLTRETLQWLLEALITGNVPGLGAAVASESQKALFEKLKSILPTENEMEGVMGVKIGQTLVTDDGLVIQSALDLPAP
ncbi:MAG TPA: hypothetical protein VG125_09005 [Pirellulales bacterium]|jgi:hypothetical protein|nr:hypothetical protein [Pirellulales bacterium]